MDADLRLAGRSESTRIAYIRCARNFVKFWMQSPDRLGEAEVRKFLLHLIEERKLGVGSHLQYLGALKFLYRVTLQRPEVVAAVPWPRNPRRRLNVLTRDEVRRIIEATTSPFWRTFFAAAYSAGLRRMEVANLRVEHIDSEAGLLRIVGGKGNKDREVMLDPTLLAALRRHWRTHGLRGPWLFPARSRAGVWMARSVRLEQASKAFAAAVKAARIGRRVTLHGLRHAFATHMLEDGLDLYTLQVLLGHERIETTTRYTQVRTDRIRATRSPLRSLWP
jgi:site-specific recombinase XerD